MCRARTCRWGGGAVRVGGRVDGWVWGGAARCLVGCECKGGQAQALPRHPLPHRHPPPPPAPHAPPTHPCVRACPQALPFHVDNQRMQRLHDFLAAQGWITAPERGGATHHHQQQQQQQAAAR